MIRQIFFDGSDQRRDACETAATETFVGELSEPTLDQIQPRAGCRSKVQMKPGMALNPRFDPRMFMRAVVVHDEMKIEFGGCLLIDFLEEPDELLMAMTRHTIADHFAVEHAEGGKEGGRAMALKIVSHGSAAAFFQRKTGLGSVQSLDLTLLIHRQDQRFVRRIQIQTYDIAQFLDKTLVSTDFKCFDQMRLQIVPFPDSADSRFAEVLGLSHGPCTPMGGIRGLCVQGRFNHGLDFSRRDFGDATGSRGIFFQSRQTQSQEPLSPELDGRSRNTQLASDISVQPSFGRPSDDLGALDQSSGKAPAMSPRLLSLSFLGG